VREPKQMIAEAYADLNEVAALAIAGESDGYVLELAGTSGHVVSSLTTLMALRLLASRAGDGQDIQPADLEDPAWWFRLNGHRFFVLEFSSAFPAHSPRSTYGTEGRFLVFQHQEAFRRRFPTGALWQVHESVRKLFAQAGQGYADESGVCGHR
jgi:YqcI/YcgG family